MVNEPKLVTDTSAAAWIAERLWSWMGTSEVHVGSLVPEGFEAYIRVFHPIGAGRWEKRKKVRWATLASENNAVTHAEMQWHKIARLSDPHDQLPGYESPTLGSMDFDECEALVAILERFTSTPEQCWFCIWDGFGDLPRFKGPTVQTDGRSYFLFEGQIRAALSFGLGMGSLRFQSPSIWWPEDHGWCVATDIDFRETFVGGTRSCVEAITTSSRLEALPIGLDARIDWMGDNNNI